MVDPRTGYVYETEDAGNSGFYKFVPVSHRPASIRAAASTCWRSSNEPNADLGVVLADRHHAGTCSGCRIDDPLARDAVLLRAGRGQGRRALQPARRRLVGRPHRLLPLDQRRQRRRGPGVRVRPARRDAQGRSTTRRTRTSSTTRTTSPSRRAAACCSARTRPATASPKGERLVGLTLDGEAFTFAMNNIILTARLQRRRSRPATTGRPSGRAPATARTAAGCSSTSRRPA